MSRGVRERFLKDERGFTLTEMMVTIMIMMVVFFALYSIFDMSLRVFSFGNNKVEAVESARVGMEKMEREIRAAYPVDASRSDDLFFRRQRFARATRRKRCRRSTRSPSATTSVPMAMETATIDVR